MMASSFVKDPDAVLDYTFDWSAWLVSGDTLTSHTITAATGITVDSSAISASAQTVVVWLSAGTAGTDYAVLCRVVTVGGRTDDRTMTIKVRAR